MKDRVPGETQSSSSNVVQHQQPPPPPRHVNSLLNRLSIFSSIKSSSSSTNSNQGYSLGISIVQGTDNNVYVKDLVHNGPGKRSGVTIGDQVEFNYYTI